MHSCVAHFYAAVVWCVAAAGELTLVKWQHLIWNYVLINLPIAVDIIIKCLIYGF